MRSQIVVLHQTSRKGCDSKYLRHSVLGTCGGALRSGAYGCGGGATAARVALVWRGKAQYEGEPRTLSELAFHSQLGVHLFEQASHYGKAEPAWGKEEPLPSRGLLEWLEESGPLLRGDSPASIANRDLDVVPCHRVGDHFHGASLAGELYSVRRQIEEHTP